ncbi:MAG: hypothetical protein CL840_16390 [Crocinitomicaceae bacterium]|nr:hypothetical protein [Crocinitomicaceae bacterium]|tara:strand:+ start:4416 stop:4748 length:333 start_codon:yes stop_codon:yes gene_type:complete
MDSRGGFHEQECIHVAQQLEQLGCDALVLSGGFTSKTPFYLMRGKVPLKGMIENGENWAEKLTMRLFGSLIVKTYDFEPNYLLKLKSGEIEKSRYTHCHECIVEMEFDAY